MVGAWLVYCVLGGAASLDAISSSQPTIISTTTRTETAGVMGGDPRTDHASFGDKGGDPKTVHASSKKRAATRRPTTPSQAQRAATQKPTMLPSVTRAATENRHAFSLETGGDPETDHSLRSNGRESWHPKLPHLTLSLLD